MGVMIIAGINVNQIVLAVLILLNIYGFSMAGLDKSRARKKLWRIPEQSFFAVSLLGGSIGVYLGLLFFRHKTRHKHFMLGIPAIIIIQVLAALYLLDFTLF